ncbi:MAG: alpha/beta hydrolase, partial [Bacteroidota bacterium]
YQIRTDRYLKKVHCPIFLIHGTKDRLISFKQSQLLAQINPSQTKLFAIEGGGHNDLPSFAEYHDYLYDILNEEAIFARLEQRSSCGMVA